MPRLQEQEEAARKAARSFLLSGLLQHRACLLAFEAPAVAYRRAIFQNPARTLKARCFCTITSITISADASLIAILRAASASASGGKCRRRRLCVARRRPIAMMLFSPLAISRANVHRFRHSC
jgi:hypothetical protein